MSEENSSYMHSRTEDLIYEDGKLRGLSDVVEDVDGGLDPLMYEDFVEAYGEGPVERSAVEPENHLDSVGMVLDVLRCGID